MAEEAKALIEKRIAEYHIDCDLTWGYLHVASKPRKVRDLEAMQEEWARYGYFDHHLLGKAELAEKIGTDFYYGGLREARAGHFPSAQLLYRACRGSAASGIEIYEHSRVIRCETGVAPKAWTDTGSVAAKYMIIACDAYVDRLADKLYYAIMPVTSFVVATEKLGPDGRES